MAASNKKTSSTYSFLSPNESTKDTRARVMFRSYTWTPAAADLVNTIATVKGVDATTIHLYLPANFTENYGTQWEDTDQVTALIAEGAGNVKASAWEATYTAFEKSGVAGIGNAFKFNKGVTAFPGKFLSFINGDPISPSFTFDLLPMNATEGTKIVNMVKYLKRTILPKFNTGGYLEYPNIWDIQFTGIKGLGHPDTPDHYSDMALIGVKIAYGGGEQSALIFKDGNPVNVTLTLDFKSIKHAFVNS
jgi:hypothetical protein